MPSYAKARYLRPSATPGLEDAKAPGKGSARRRYALAILALTLLATLPARAQQPVGPVGDNTFTNYIWFHPDYGTTMSGTQLTQWRDLGSNYIALPIGGPPTVNPLDATMNYSRALSGGGSMYVEDIYRPISNGGAVFMVARTSATGQISSSAAPMATLENNFPTGGPVSFPAGAFTYGAIGSGWGRYSTSGTLGGLSGWAYPYNPAVYEIKSDPNLLRNIISGQLVSSNGIGTSLQVYDLTIRRYNGYAVSNFASLSWVGSFGELMIFFDPITDNQRERIRSYLAFKYGVTLYQGGSGQDYIASDNNTLMWSVAKGGSYKDNIAGIGRDDASGLIKVKSQPMRNDNGVVMMEAEGEGTNNAPTLVDIDNMEFLSWGDNSAALSEISTDMPTDQGFLGRIAREWRAQQVGDVGTVRLSGIFPIASVSGDHREEFRLLIDADGDFSSGARAIWPDSYSATATQKTVVFSNLTLADGEYFTFVTNVDPLVVNFTQTSGSSLEAVGDNLPQVSVSGRVSTVNYSFNVILNTTSPGTATAGTDFTPSFATPVSITIPAGDYLTPRNFPIPGLAITDDQVVEADETIQLGLSVPGTTNNVVVGSAQDSATVYTIQNDDNIEVSFNQATGSSPENVGGSLPQLTVVGAITTQDIAVEVGLAAAPGTATPGIDYSPDFASTFTVTIPAGNYLTARTVPIVGLSITDELIIEGNETINLELRAPFPAGVTLGAQSATVYTIENDDRMTVLFNQATGSGQEDVGDNLPRLAVSGGITESDLLVVVYLDTPPGTATLDEDYTLPGGFHTLIIPPADYTAGDTLEIADLAILPDSDIEPDETIRLELGVVSPYVDINGPLAKTTYTIVNDDGLTVVFSQATGTSPENVGASLPQLSVSGASITSSLTLQVGLSVAAGSATAGVDYSPSFAAPVTVTIPVGDYTTAQLIPIPGLAITNDNMVEADETINLELINPDVGVIIGVQGTTVYTIVNDDFLTVVFNQSFGLGQEDVGDNLPQLSVSGAVSSSALSVQVELSAAPGTATAGADYMPSFAAPITVAIPAGNYTTAQLVPISGLSITADNEVEADETINLELRDPPPAGVTLGVQRSTSYAIANDDNLTAVFSQATGSSPENVGADLPQVAVSGASIATAKTIQVRLSAAPGTATAGVDYSPSFAAPVTVTIPAGDYATERLIPIPGLAITNDNMVEADETINLELINPSSNVLLGVQGTTAYTIENDDNLTAIFSQATGSSPENVGDNLPQLSVSGARLVSALTIEVALDSDPGTATAGVDYMPSFAAPITVTIPAGDYATAQLIPIPGLAITGDNELEADETLRLRLSNPSAGVAIGAQGTTVYTIANDDGLTVVFSQATGSSPENVGGNLPQLSVSGGNSLISLSIQVTLDSDPGTATAGVDYAPEFITPITITIPAGNYTVAQLIPIPGLAITNDNIMEADETLRLRLANPASGLSIGSPGITVYTIENDESLTVVFNQATGSGQEDVGDNLPQLSVSGAVSITPYRAQVSLSTPPGSATPGVDYSPSFAVPLTVTIPVGDYTTGRLIPIPGLTIIDDNIAEGDEDFSLSLSSSEIRVGGQSSSSYTIIDDEPLPQATLSVSANQVSESGSAVIITVSLSSPSSNSVEITLALSGTANERDYIVSPAVLTIAPGNLSATATLTPIDDAIHEGDETVIVSMGRLVNAQQATPQVETIIILDNDPPVAVSLSVDQLTINEANGRATFTATLNGATENDVVVNLAFGGDATQGVDYTFAPQPMVIRAGSVSATAQLIPIADQVNEAEETVTVQILSVSNANIDPSRASVQLRIVDNSQKPMISLRAFPQQIQENGGVSTLTLELSQVSGQAVSVELLTSGSASQADFVLSQTQVVIPPGSQQFEVSLTAIDDMLSEGTEMVIVQLANALNANIDGTSYSVRISILDDDGLKADGGFSPNGDGVNDHWVIGNIEKYPDNYVRIYNRWGNMVYEVRGYNNANKVFEGRANTGMLIIGNAGLPDGTYFYQITPGDGSPDVSGFIAMFR